MVDADKLRALAGKMLAMALAAPDAELARRFALRASEYLEQAQALGEADAMAATPPAIADLPKH